MARLLLIRPIHPLPGRHQEALRWLAETEPERRQAGQVYQFVLHSTVDSTDYQLLQVWQDRQAYEHWRETAVRSRLADERRRYLTIDAARLFEVIS